MRCFECLSVKRFLVKENSLESKMGQVETAFESLARRNRISRNKMETSVFLGKLRLWPRTRGNFGFKSTTSTVEYVRTRHGYLVT